MPVKMLQIIKSLTNTIKRKLLPFLLIPLILLSINASPLSGEEEDDAKIDEEMLSTMPILVTMEPFILNLRDSNRYIKFDLQFELINGLVEEHYKSVEPKIRDAIMILMNYKTIDSLSGARGKFKLKDEILIRANRMVGENIITNIYFTEFVIQ